MSKTRIEGLLRGAASGTLEHDLLKREVKGFAYLYGSLVRREPRGHNARERVHVEVLLHSLRDAPAECRYGDTVQEWYIEGCRSITCTRGRGEVYQEVPPRELSMMCTRANFVGGVAHRKRCLRIELGRRTQREGECRLRCNRELALKSESVTRKSKYQIGILKPI
ncbi:hypothetical protein B0H34DRAFT_671686 [Crassisporium funariophilum]|nr:hypothetical protein B0H34DRAFT_671686 [Crassisporium funariophilum]